MAELLIVDIGFGNVRSVKNALERTKRDDQRVVLTDDPAAIEGAERLVISGVGAFPECKKKLEASGLLAPLTAAVDGGKPLLGICVGMQILADEGLEFAPTPGLGWVPGIVRKLVPGEEDGRARKLPHVGWTRLEAPRGPLFEGVPSGAHVYFVHSFTFDRVAEAHVAARATYGETFVAAVHRANVFGCQFHPERSDAPGLRILENFCRWTP